MFLCKKNFEKSLKGELKVSAKFDLILKNVLSMIFKKFFYFFFIFTL